MSNPQIKLRIGVFMGGKSSEREVSFNSGRTICDHLDTEKYTIIPIFQNITGELYILPWKFLHRGKVSDFEDRLTKEAQKIVWDDLKNILDFVYIAAHGQYAEDGILQGTLEVLQIPYLGSKVFASALSMDKFIQKDVLKSNNILTPISVNLNANQVNDLDDSQKCLENLINRLNKKNISLPIIIKPQKSGSSLGITVVKDKNNLISAIKKASSIESVKEQGVLVEEYIKGLEFTCIVITDNEGKDLPLIPTEIVPEENTDLFDYKQKYMPGRATKYTPARCNPEQLKLIQETSIAVKKALNIENIARIDGFLVQDNNKLNKVIITDPNTLAGMAPSSFIFRQAAEFNMSHTNFINHLIETELKNYNMNINQSINLNNDKNSPKIKIGVLLGGPSNEKEISLESGRNIVYKLSPKKYTAIPLFVDQNLNIYKINQKLLVRNSTKEISEDLSPEMLVKWSDLPNIVDFVFIGLHGAHGENGSIQGMLEMLNLPYNGSSVLTSSLCMDKYKTNNFLRTKGFNVPKSSLISKSEWLVNQESIVKDIHGSISYPLIAKPHDDGCSFFVEKINNKEELIQTINNIFATKKTHVLIEELIYGTELTIGVIGNNSSYALPPTRTIVNKDILSIEEKFLPGAGENQTPANITKEALELVQQTAKKCYSALNCKGYSRIDCFYQNKEQSSNGQEKIIILEVNTLPALTPATCIFHQASEIGLKPMEFIDLIIELGLEEHTKKSNNFKDTVNKKLTKLFL